MSLPKPGKMWISPNAAEDGKHIFERARAVLEKSGLGWCERAVLADIVIRCGSNGYCIFKIADFAKDFNTSRQNMSRTLNNLIKNEWLRCERKPNKYIFFALGMRFDEKAPWNHKPEEFYYGNVVNGHFDPTTINTECRSAAIN